MNLYEMFDPEGPNKLTLVDALRDFLPIAVKFLKLKTLPKIHLVKELHDTHVPTFGRFENDTREISVVVDNRNPVDIIRTLSHELAHYAQEERGELDSDSWHTGSSAENQAHEQAGIMMREFDKQFPAYLGADPVIIPSGNVAEDWQKANKRDRTDGMSKKAVKAYRREHPGSKLKTAVTTKPSKLKKGSADSKRRKSYCSRSLGQKKMHNIDCTKTPDKAICKARKRWNC